MNPISDAQILEIASKWVKEEGWFDFERNDFMACVHEVIYTALKSALDAAEKQEPFCWYHTTIQGEVKFTTKKPSWDETVWPPLYTHPAPTVPEE